MCAEVVMAGSQSSSFVVDVGVKQGHVLAPIIFNVLLVAITFVSHYDLPSDSVGVEYRHHCGFFNLLFQAKAKTSYVLIYALQYADDAAFLLLMSSLRHISVPCLQYNDVTGTQCVVT